MNEVIAKKSETPNQLLDEARIAKRRNGVADFFIRLLKEKPLGTIGGIIVLILLLTGIFANIISPYGFAEIHLDDRLAPPSAKYILGTDHVGRDLLSRVIFGARISLIVGLVGTTISILVSLFVGIPSGFIGGKTDLVIQRFVDAWMAFPALLLLITLLSLTGPGLWNVTIAVGFLFGIGGSRVIRGAVIAIKENAYIQAAIALGAPTWKILLTHVLPNVMAPTIILFTTRMGSVILTEASLSFLGYGIPPPTPSWGGMLSGIGRQYMLSAPWLVLWSGIALSLVVYGTNMFGDAMRDLLDPRLRGGIGRYEKVNIKKKIRK